MRGHKRRGTRGGKTLIVLTIMSMLTSISSGIALGDGTETLGPPSVPLAEGSGFVASGVGLENGQPGTINLTVPAGASVAQALLYWEGQSLTSTGGDNTITVNGTSVTGALIGGPTRFFGRAWSSTYRADITGLGLVGPGANSLAIAGMNFSRVNNGAGVLVVYDDGSRQDLALRDGNDLAFINFASPLDTTVPQTFTFDAVSYDRVVDATMFASSVTDDGIRPNAVVATVDGVETLYVNPFDSTNGSEWDTVVIQIDVPAGATSLTLQALSTDTENTGKLPASFAWLGAAVSVPLPASLGDYVWFDANEDGLQDPDEVGVEDVLVTLNDCGGNFVASQLTGPDGEYLFTGLEPGCYQVTFTAPDGTAFTVQNAGPDDIDSDADPATGVTPQVTLAPGEQNLTIDAGLVPLVPGIDIEKLTNGNQADGANDPDVPQIAPGDPVTWTYVVTNTGTLPFEEADVVVTDDIIGAITTIVDKGDGDDVLAPGEVWIYEATGVAQDLDSPSPGTVVVDGCNPGGVSGPGDRATYENIGTVTVPGDDDSDPSHYCNPPRPGIDIEKLTNGNDADGANDGDVPQIAPGDPVTWTYVVTNTGNVPFDLADVVVTDDIVGAITNIVDQGDGDGVLAPGETWTYEEMAPGGAQDLSDPAPGTVIVEGCNPAGTPVPGDRATYENIGTVTVPGDEDSDPSHYCNPPEPGIDIEKLTNGNQADGANDDDVPFIARNETVTWTYLVTNTGDVAFAAADVTVTDNVDGVTPVFDPASDVGSDGVLSPGEVWTYTATAVAPNLASLVGEPFIVDGCNPAGTPAPGDRATYENIGTVMVPGDEDSDPSHYCNPPRPRVDIEKLTNGNDADGANDADVPQIAPGDPVTWTYIVTNTGDVAFDEADVVVEDDIIGPITNIVDKGDGDGVLAPGETWTYEATAPNGAQDLADPEPGTVIVDGCNPAGTPVPGDRATYENIGRVTVPGDRDSDPSHYCNPPEPGIDIEKLTNGNQADGANDADVPQIASGDPVTWTYVVTNTGEVTFDEANVDVTDDIIGSITDIVDKGDGDAFLEPGEVWTYQATATNGAQDLANPIPGTVVVNGCNPDGTPVPGDRATYENIGTVMVPGDEDSDPSHYCNPPDPGIDIEKLTNGNQADGANDADVPQIAPGDTVTWTYVVTNTGNVAFALTDVTVADNVAGVSPVLDPASDVGADGILSPGEMWRYEASAQAGDLASLVGEPFIVEGCNPAGTPVPGDRATYENIGTVTVPGDEDSDPSHYCNPPQPDIDIEKFTKVIAIPTGGDLCDTFDKPSKLTMVYTGDGPEATSNSQDPGKVVVTGDPNDASPVRIVASKDARGGGDVYFDGTVDLDGEFVIDSTFAGQDDLASNTHVTIYAPNGAILQEIEFHTSCSQPLLLGDQYGAARLVGFIDKNGDGSTLPPPTDDFGEDADVPTGPTANTGDTIQWTYVVTNPGALALADVVVTDDNGTAGDPADDFAPDPILDGGLNVGDDNGDGLLDPGEEWLFRATGIAQLGQYANLSNVVGQPVVNGDPFGDPVTDEDPSHYIGVFGGDLCETFDKPSKLTMVYTGDGPEATSNSQDPGKVVVTGDPNDASPVRIVASKDPRGGGEVYFDGTVDLDGEFVIDSMFAGQDDLASNTHVTIYAPNGAILQEIEFHTSCSQPLFIGDQFGAIRLADFVDKNGNGPGTVPASGVVLDSSTFKDKELKIKVKNVGTMDASLTSVQVGWPTSPNGGLTEIKRGGDSVYKPGSPVLTSPLVLSESGWTAGTDKRTVKDGDTEEIKFKFQNNALQDPSAYSIVMTFSDGSVVTFGS